MRRRDIALGSVTLLVIGCLPAALDAQGLSVHDQTACTAGRGGTAVAAPCADGSAVLFNPAALALQPPAVGFGGTLLHIDAEFRFDAGERVGFRDQFIPIPHVFVNRRPTDRLAVALGLFAPYGLRTAWPLDFEGRFVGYDNRLQTIYIQPSLAYQIVPRRVAVGAGLDIVHGRVRLERRLDLAMVSLPGLPSPAALGIPAGTDFADADLEGSAWAATGHIGIVARPSDRLAAGARYLHSVDLDFDDAEADFEPIPTGIVLPEGNPFGLPAGTPLDAVLATLLFGEDGILADQPVSTRLTLPGQFVVGLAYRFSRALRAHAEYQWTGWSSVDRAVLDFARLDSDTIFFGWDDTNTFRAGAEYDLAGPASLRAGWTFSEAAAPDVAVTPLLPDADRYHYHAGAGYRLSRRLRMDAAFVWVHQVERRGRVRPLASPDARPEDVNVGTYNADALLFGLTFAYRLGAAGRARR